MPVNPPVNGILNLIIIKMKAKSWLVIATTLFIASSCGENSTKTTETGTGDTVSVNTDASTITPTTTTIVVPDPVQATFRQKYPDVRDVTWSRYEPVSNFDWEWSGWPALDTGDYVARFNWNNSDYWAWYDNDNNWIGSVATISDFNSLPASVNKTISTEYNGYTIESVDLENDKDKTAYEIDLTKGEDKVTLLLDENGKIMKKKSKIDDEKTKIKVQK
jgi:hypothetical protein